MLLLEYKHFLVIINPEEKQSSFYIAHPLLLHWFNTHVDSMSSGSVSSELTEPVNKHL
jgi:hypothetical protein